MTLPIVITPGEPAGIGPDITLSMLENWTGHPVVVAADSDLLAQRANLLDLQCNWPLFDNKKKVPVSILPITLRTPSVPGMLTAENASYVLESIEKATQGCLDGRFSALITGPVHKAIINKSGIAFAGHTEFLGELCDTGKPVMTFLTDFCPVSLLTTHIPLREVPDAITETALTHCIQTLRHGLKHYFNVRNPHIAVCGLNPHAGESGQLGTEERDIIEPTLLAMRAKGFQLTGPVSADTLFTAQQRNQYDAILSLYHDQGLTAVKALGFGHGIQMSLGLPFLRVSVDHGTALSLAGTGQASHQSLQQALSTTEQLIQHTECHHD